MKDVFIVVFSAILGYVFAISHHGRENIMQSRWEVLKVLFELESAVANAYKTGTFSADLQVHINRCELCISCLCASMPLHFILCRKIRKAWKNVEIALNDNRPISAGYTLSAINDKKATAANQAIEALIRAVAGK